MPVLVIVLLEVDLEKQIFFYHTVLRPHRILFISIVQITVNAGKLPTGC